MNTLPPSFFNQSSSFLQITRTCMKAWMSRYIDSETLNPAVLFQFIDYDSVSQVYVSCEILFFKSKILCDGRFKGYHL